MARFEKPPRNQMEKTETELAEMKAMQTKFIDTVAQMLAEQKSICSQTKAAALTNSDMMVKLTQLCQRVTRVEEQINIPRATIDYVDYQETSSTCTQRYQSGGLIIPPGAGSPQFNLTMVQHPSAQTPLVASASGRMLSSTPTAKDEAASCKIRFESHGVVYEKPLNRDVPFLAICPDLCRICVFEAPNGNTPFRCLRAVNASQIVVNHDLNHVTFQTFETRDGQVNVQWTAGDKCYYTEFADWTIQPGELLMKALQACGLPVLPAAHAAEPSPVEENIFSASALSKSPLKDPAVEALSRIGRAEETSKSFFFSTPFATPAATLPTFTGVAPSSSTGILPTPVAPTAPPPSTTSASPFSFSFNKPTVLTSSGKTNTGGLSNPPVSTFGGFTFSTTAPLKTSSLSDNVRTAEKPEKDALNPFSDFSFGLTKSGDQTPALGGWPTTTTAPPSSITVKTTFSFSAPTTAVPSIASSPSGSKDVAANDEQGASDAEDEHYECTVQFRPVIELPQLVETKTDEEGEDVKFCERAKLYRYDTESHEWKERGLGEMKILRNQTTGKYRVLMRLEQTLKICANHQIIPGLKLMPRKKPTKYTWAAPDLADGEQKNEQFVIRFKTEEQAEKFKEVFEEGLVSSQSMSPVKPQAPSGGASSGAAAVSSPFEFGIQAAVKEAKKEKKLLSLGELFKLSWKSWNCTNCYVNNSPTSDKCSACKTVKSGNAPTGPFKFGLSTPFVFRSGDEDSSAQSQVSEALTSSTFTFSTTPATSPTFPFGNTPATSSTFTFGTTPATSPTFTFGTSSATPPPCTFGTAPATSVVAQPATSFVFGPTVNTPNALATTAKKGDPIEKFPHVFVTNSEGKIVLTQQAKEFVNKLADLQYERLLTIQQGPTKDDKIFVVHGRKLETPEHKEAGKLAFQFYTFCVENQQVSASRMKEALSKLRLGFVALMSRIARQARQNIDKIDFGPAVIVSRRPESAGAQGTTRDDPRNKSETKKKKVRAEPELAYKDSCYFCPFEELNIDETAATWKELATARTSAKMHLRRNHLQKSIAGPWVVSDRNYREIFKNTTTSAKAAGDSGPLEEEFRKLSQQKKER